jgi:hypothetical protein
VQDEEEKETAVGIEITKDGRGLIREKRKGKREMNRHTTILI